MLRINPKEKKSVNLDSVVEEKEIYAFIFQKSPVVTVGGRVTVAGRGKVLQKVPSIFLLFLSSFMGI